MTACLSRKSHLLSAAVSFAGGSDRPSAQRSRCGFAPRRSTGRGNRGCKRLVITAIPGVPAADLSAGFAQSVAVGGQLRCCSQPGSADQRPLAQAVANVRRAVDVVSRKCRQSFNYRRGQEYAAASDFACVERELPGGSTKSAPIWLFAADPCMPNSGRWTLKLSTNARVRLTLALGNSRSRR